MLHKTSAGQELSKYITWLYELGVMFSPQCFLAGGSIRRAITGEPIEGGDFDIFVLRGAQSVAPGSKLFDDAPVFTNSAATIKTWTTVVDKRSVQLHVTQIKSMEQQLKEFDFTCCQFAFDGEAVWYVGDALKDTRERILRVTGYMNDPAKSVARSFRLMGLGFKPDKASLLYLEKRAAALSKTGSKS